MPKEILDPENLRLREDWEGNNIAVMCPLIDCGQVFIVSALLHKEGRKCPKCDESTGYVEGGRKSGGTAWIEW